MQNGRAIFRQNRIRFTLPAIAGALSFFTHQLTNEQLHTSEAAVVGALCGFIYFWDDGFWDFSSEVKNRKKLNSILIAAIFGLTALLCAKDMTYKNRSAVVGIALIGVLYTGFNSKICLRRIPLVKNLIPATTWAVCAVYFPFLKTQSTTNWQFKLLIFTEIFSTIFQISIFWDLRDKDVDRLDGVRTWATSQSATSLCKALLGFNVFAVILSIALGQLEGVANPLVFNSLFRIGFVAWYFSGIQKNDTRVSSQILLYHAAIATLLVVFLRNAGTDAI